MVPPPVSHVPGLAIVARGTIQVKISGMNIHVAGFTILANAVKFVNILHPGSFMTLNTFGTPVTASQGKFGGSVIKLHGARERHPGLGRMALFTGDLRQSVRYSQSQKSSQQLAQYHG